MTAGTGRRTPEPQDYRKKSGMVANRSRNVEYETLKFCCNNEQGRNHQARQRADVAQDGCRRAVVSYRIIEGNKERVQSFRGVVIQIKGSGKTKMFTIRKVSNGVGVERIFPLYSPHIDKIEVNKVGVVRRARIYYLRDLTGKKARIKEKRMTRTEK